MKAGLFGFTFMLVEFCQYSLKNNMSVGVFLQALFPAFSMFHQQSSLECSSHSDINYRLICMATAPVKCFIKMKLLWCCFLSKHC